MGQWKGFPVTLTLLTKNERGSGIYRVRTATVPCEQYGGMNSTSVRYSARYFMKNDRIFRVNSRLLFWVNSATCLSIATVSLKIWGVTDATPERRATHRGG